MSRSFGKLPRRVAAIVGSACFLGGMALVASPADAGVYLSLKPNTTNLAPGSFAVSGNVFSGYTLTLAPGSYSGATAVKYDLVAAITNGAGTSQVGLTDPRLLTVRGAVRTSTVAGAPVYNHTGGTGFTWYGTYGAGPATTVDPSVLAASYAGTPVASGLGPQTGSFGSSDSPLVTNVDRQRFELQLTSTTTTSVSGVNIPDPVKQSQTVDGASAIIVGRAELTTASGAASDSFSLTAVGGNGALGTTPTNALAQYFEAYSASNRSGTIKYSYTDGATNPLTVVFQNLGPSLVKGDFGGSESPDGTFNTPDGTGADTLDVEGFLLAVNSPAAYLALNPTLTAADLITLGDYGGSESLDGTFNTPDGAFDTLDVEGFLLAVNNPAGYAAIQPPAPLAAFGAPVPEPVALGLLAPAAMLLGRRRR